MINLNFFLTKNKFKFFVNKHFGERDKAQGVYRNMKGCILEASFEGVVLKVVLPGKEK